VVAASFEQTERVFSNMRSCVGQSPTLSQWMTGYESEVQVNGSPSRAFRLPAMAGTADGLKPSCALFDELAEMVGPNRSRVHMIVSNGLAKRTDTLEFNTSTPGWDLETTAGKLYQHGLKVNSGEAVDDSFLFVAWSCPSDRYDLDNPDELRAAIRASSPAADLFLDVESVAAKYNQVPRAEFERYFLGIWTSSAQSWLPAGSWEKCARPDIVIPDHSEVVLAFDGSVNADSTGVVVVGSYDGKPHIQVVDCWERPEGAAADHWRVPVESVEEVIRESCRRWKVKEIIADEFRWERSLQILESDGLPVVRMPQTAARMAPASSRFYEMVLAGQLSHDNDPRLARHIGNSVLRVTPRGAYVSKPTKWSTARVDLALCSVMGVDRAAVVEPDYCLVAEPGSGVKASIW
jgi:phage terminase large subunit-like protein